VQADASLKEAAAYILKHGIHRAVVLDNERPIGIITSTDFVRAVAEGLP
jgi:CBS domain-containing protein